MGSRASGSGGCTPEAGRPAKANLPDMRMHSYDCLVIGDVIELSVADLVTMMAASRLSVLWWYRGYLISLNGLTTDVAWVDGHCKVTLVVTTLIAAACKERPAKLSTSDNITISVVDVSTSRLFGVFRDAIGGKGGLV